MEMILTNKFKSLSSALLMSMLMIGPAFGALLPHTTNADAILEDQVTTVKAKVLSIDSTSDESLPGGSGARVPTQQIHVEILEGAGKGTAVDFSNDYPIQLSVGDQFYLRKMVVAESGQIFYTVSDPYRLNWIFIFIGIFVLLVVVFGGKQGVRGLASLAGSLLLILYVLIPSILHGYSPIAASIGVASLIIVLGSYITHGFNKTTTSAVAGMIVTVGLVGMLAHFAVAVNRFTGFATEESVYLNLNTGGHIDFVGLLLGGMLIGLLGVLYDAAIGQAISVEELHSVAPHLSRWTIYKRAIRIGREHIGALVNTLAIAYVGVSLPLLLLFSTNDTPFWQIINRENFAAEIIRTMIGSIGLVLAVPVTTLLATLILIRKKHSHVDASKIEEEQKELEHFHHHH
jgi:uncharacterized membrane protein